MNARSRRASIIYTVAQYYGVALTDLYGRNRRWKPSLARQIAWYLIMRELPETRHAELAVLFNRARGTVTSGLISVSETLSVDTGLQAELMSIRTILAQSQFPPSDAADNAAAITQSNLSGEQHA